MESLSSAIIKAIWRKSLGFMAQRSQQDAFSSHTDIYPKQLCVLAVPAKSNKVGELDNIC